MVQGTEGEEVMKRAFTIVELLMVIGILAVLMTIVTTAAGGAIREARSNRANALVSMIQSGLETYYAQNDRWPGNFGDKVEKGLRSNISDDPDRYQLTEAEVDDMIGKMVLASVRGNNPLLDVSGLFVCRKELAGKDNAPGMDLMDMVKGTKRHPQKVKSVSAMCFGYPDDKGKFRRFKIVYSIPSDSITVSKQ